MEWEYKTEPVENYHRSYDRISADRLNKLGKDGWELVMMYKGELVFKRIKNKTNSMIVRKNGSD